MQAELSLAVISLGGGVQSSVMALMASQGAFDRVPDCAIFADTRWEPPRQRVPVGTTVELWLGISTDEAIRMKDSRDRWMANRYPLIEAGMSRRDCLDWWQKRYDRPLERSACVACPFQSRQRWVETKRRWPELFAEAVEIDARLRGGLAFAKEPYLHTLRMPLAEAVALDEAELGTDGQRGRVRQRVRGTLWGVSGRCV